ncbi:TPA: hypothetical protein DDW35_06085 [Candidatus Sumerlaeota bacterium]|jgi:general secretion pathway protein D|nr:hypothetical protein [Candidatus Sumerlaeota bacterium]
MNSIIKTTTRVGLILALAIFACFPAAAQMGGGGMGGMGGGMSMGGNTGSSSNRSGSSSTSASSTAGNAGTATIDYNAETGTILVICDDATNENVKRVIAELDKPAPQVMIKALFLELSHGSDSDLGMMGTLKSAGKTVGTASGSSTVIDTLASTFGSDTTGYGAAMILQEKDWNITINALAKTSKLNVLSRPTILARSTVEATITVGEEVPIITSSETDTDTETVTNSIEYKSVGISLIVTPTIYPDGMVQMEVTPSISTLTGETVSTGSGGGAVPYIASRAAETTVVVPSGSTVVLGGLMQDKDTKDVTKIPYLGDIPYLGTLFRRTVTSKEKTELAIFITPLIVQTKDELAKAKKWEYGKIDMKDADVSAQLQHEYIDEFMDDGTNTSTLKGKAPVDDTKSKDAKAASKDKKSKK